MTVTFMKGYFLFLAFLANDLLANLQASKATTTIVISLDGVGWQFVGNNKTDTPNFDFIARTGVKAKNMITVNPTSTIPTHMTFVTGLYPESHGIVANNFYDPVLKAEYILETDCSYFNPMFYQESEPIWLTMEKQGIKTGTYFWPASTSYKQRPSYYGDHVCRVNCSDYTPQTLRTLRSRIGTKHCKFDSEDHPFWKRIESTIRWMKSDSPPRLVFLYFDHADGIGHTFGPNSKKYLKSIEKLDRHVVGYLNDRLKESNLFDTTNIIIVSDHSMVEISSKRQINLFESVDPSIYVSNPPGIWPIGGNSVDTVFNKLMLLNNSHIKFYKKEDIPERLHWKNNRRVPPIYADVEIGWTSRKRRYGKYHWEGGSHGWEPSEELAAIFYARGPSFKEGFYDNGTLRAIDLYPLLCHLVRIDPLPNNGSLDNMMQLLKTNKIDDRKKSTHITNNTTHARNPEANVTALNTPANNTQSGAIVNEKTGKWKPRNKTLVSSKTVRSNIAHLPRKLSGLRSNGVTATKPWFSQVAARIAVLSFVFFMF